jgi:hypothetical protein
MEMSVDDVAASVVNEAFVLSRMNYSLVLLYNCHDICRCREIENVADDEIEEFQ